MRFAAFLLACCALFALAASGRAEDPPQPPARPAPPKAAADPALPAAWHGTWKGTCRTRHASGGSTSFPMELHVAPIEGRRAWTWHIVYGAGEKRQERRYELLPGERAGHFRIDEKNGIVLDAWLAGDALHSRFGVRKSLIDATYRLEGGALHVSLVTFGAVASSTSGGTDGVPPVASYPLRAAQRGVLARQR